LTTTSPKTLNNLAKDIVYAFENRDPT